MLWLICLVVCAAQGVLVLWKATFEREIRWGLYAVRDQLRWAAIENPELLSDGDFWELDDALTRWCRNLHTLSLWPILVVARRAKASDVALIAETSPLRPFYEQAWQLLLKHIVRRHLLLGRFALRLLSRTSSGLETAAEILVQRAPERAARNSSWQTLRARVGRQPQAQF